MLAAEAGGGRSTSQGTRLPANGARSSQLRLIMSVSTFHGVHYWVRHRSRMDRGTNSERLVLVARGQGAVDEQSGLYPRMRERSEIILASAPPRCRSKSDGSAGRVYPRPRGPRVRIPLSPARRLLLTAIEAIDTAAFPPPVRLSQANFAAAAGSWRTRAYALRKLVSACDPPSGLGEFPGLVSSSGLR